MDGDAYERRSPVSTSTPVTMRFPVLPQCCPSPIWTEMTKRPRPAFPLVRTAFRTGTPDRIRTGATALRGRRARPLHNGGMLLCEQPGNLIGAGLSHKIAGPVANLGDRDLAGILGLEPRLTGPEPVVLPITPYPTELPVLCRSAEAVGHGREDYTRPLGATNSPGPAGVAVVARSPVRRATSSTNAR